MSYMAFSDINSSSSVMIARKSLTGAYGLDYAIALKGSPYMDGNRDSFYNLSFNKTVKFKYESDDMEIGSISHRNKYNKSMIHHSEKYCIPFSEIIGHYCGEELI